VQFRKPFLLLALVSLPGIAFAQSKPPADAPKPKVVHQDEFFVVGIEARTTAAREMSPQGVIPQQWQKFFQDGVLQKITNRADENIYALYTDFTDKRAGEYSVVIGVKVADKAHVPEGLVLKTIPAGNYAIFQSKKGPAPQVIPAAWQKIADAEDKGQLGLTRTYKADYEVYGAEAMDPQNLRAEIRVGVK
jgi:predicted transcriptional regulator YdeE